MSADISGYGSGQSSGFSLGSAVSVSASQSPYNVAATLQLNNHTKWPLKLESCYPEKGQVESIINMVPPGEFSIMKMHKLGFTTSGTSGTAEWQLVGTEASVIVLWSVPFNQDFHSNRLAVGVCTIGKNTREIFREMYYSPTQPYFRREDFYSVIRPVEYNDCFIKVSGLMGTTHKADIVIDVEPMFPAQRFDRNDLVKA